MTTQNSAASATGRFLRRGVVVSNKMQKTIVVQFTTSVRHPVYKKVVRRSRKVKVHDEKNEARPGDTVMVLRTRPLSKDKQWVLKDIVRRPKV